MIKETKTKGEGLNKLQEKRRSNQEWTINFEKNVGAIKNGQSRDQKHRH
jgi:hypothetical protein